VRRGVRLAQAHRVGLDLLHAFDPGAWRALQAEFDARRLSGEVPDGVAARQRLAALAESLATETGLAVSALYEVGDPAVALATQLKKSGAAAVVIARRADPEAPGIGSTLLRVLRQVPCPVLVVRGPAERDYQRVLAAVDLREVSQRAATAAVDLFPGAEHRMLSVIDPAWERERWRQSAPEAASGEGSEGLHAIAANRLDELARILSQAGERRVEAEVADGVPARVLVQRAAQWPADCVVVGRHGQGTISERLLGSTALDLIHHTARDVLVVS
jgi:nucleotide-binding universal stress UspA family protein